MQLKNISIATLILYLNFLLGCATTGPVNRQTSSEETGATKLMAVRMPEALLVIGNDSAERGKIISMDGDLIEFLPFPYWQMDSKSVSIGEITSIKVIEQQQNAIKGLSYGFASGVLLLGALGAAKSRYNTDFQIVLIGSALLGVVTGFIGLLIGASSTIRSYSHFQELSAEKKQWVIKYIMGV